MAPAVRSETVVEGRRGVPEMAYVRSSRLADLQDEVTALEAEGHDLGLRLGYISRILWRAVWTDRLDLVSEIAGELDRVSGRLIARGGG